MTGGTKHDSEKPRMDLLDVGFLVDTARVLTHGAVKYDAHNWRKGINASRLYAALQRHLCAFWDGEDIDPDSGLHHLAHAACELMFLHWTVQNLPVRDDRWFERVSPILTKTQQTDDTLDHVTENRNPVIATGDTTANHVTQTVNKTEQTGDTTEDMGS